MHFESVCPTQHHTILFVFNDFLFFTGTVGRTHKLLLYLFEIENIMANKRPDDGHTAGGAAKSSRKGSNVQSADRTGK